MYISMHFMQESRSISINVLTIIVNDLKPQGDTQWTNLMSYIHVALEMAHTRTSPEWNNRNYFNNLLVSPVRLVRIATLND